jgi:glycosyltransferase involved in cell wall biosynthesis
MTPRSILLVCHYYPPSAGAAVQRPLSMAKYLRRMGHRVTVLTTGAFGALGDDAHEHVVRTYDLQAMRARLRRERHATPILEAETYSTTPHPLSYVLVPEALVLAWAPFAVSRAVALQRQERFDCVITTSPPESGHLAGYVLQRLGAAWIADLRDGWVFESYRPAWRTHVQDRLDRWLERRLMRAADAVTSVAEPLTRYLREQLGANATTVPNGWDPERIPGGETAEAPPKLLDPQRVSLVHAGRLEVVGRDPAPLVEALATLARERPETAARLELIFAGSFTERELKMLGRDVSPGRIVVAGHLPRPAALSLQRSADGLLLVTAGTRRHEVTGKLFEYLGSGRPILALADGTEAGRIVRDAHAGVTVPAGDPAAARLALERFARGEIGPPDERARRAYAYPAVAELMAGQVEAVTKLSPAARRAARGRRQRSRGS